jgi:hypothetical protein
MHVPPVFKSHRAVLWMGFGSLVTIILLIGWKGSLVVRALESQSNDLRAAYVQRDEWLDSIRF